MVYSLSVPMTLSRSLDFRRGLTFTTSSFGLTSFFWAMIFLSHRPPVGSQSSPTCSSRPSYLNGSETMYLAVLRFIGCPFLMCLMLLLKLIQPLRARVDKRLYRRRTLLPGPVALPVDPRWLDDPPHPRSTFAYHASRIQHPVDDFALMLLRAAVQISWHRVLLSALARCRYLAQY